MCKWGTTTTLRLKTMASLSHTGEDYWRDWEIDSCIAPIVKALQDAGIDMLGSCCGHGNGNGSIVLADGRELRIGVYSDEAGKPLLDRCIAALERLQHNSGRF